MQSFRPEKSLNVDLIEYDPTCRECHVTFKSNKKRYTHTGVPPQAFENWQKDPSAGKFYWVTIARNYPLKKEKDTNGNRSGQIPQSV